MESEFFREMTLRSVLLALSAAWPAMACSCASYEPVKACQIFQRTPVIFRGRVLDHNDDPTAGLAQMTLYRFQVLEAFKGLRAGTTQVRLPMGIQLSITRAMPARRKSKLRF